MVHPIMASAPRPKSLAVKIARRRNFLVLFSHEFLLSPFFTSRDWLGYKRLAKAEIKYSSGKTVELKSDANYKSPGIHPNKCTQAAERS